MTKIVSDEILLILKGDRGSRDLRSDQWGFGRGEHRCPSRQPAPPTGHLHVPEACTSPGAAPSGHTAAPQFTPGPYGCRRDTEEDSRAQGRPASREKAAVCLYSSWGRQHLQSARPGGLLPSRDQPGRVPCRHPGQDGLLSCPGFSPPARAGQEALTRALPSLRPQPACSPNPPAATASKGKAAEKQQVLVLGSFRNTGPYARGSDAGGSRGTSKCFLSWQMEEGNHHCCLPKFSGDDAKRGLRGPLFAKSIKAPAPGLAGQHICPQPGQGKPECPVPLCSDPPPQGTVPLRRVCILPAEETAPPRLLLCLPSLPGLRS